MLAAAWLELLSAEEIAQEISHSLDFLETDMADVPERQRSIRAVFDYSWRLLNADEQTLFPHLSVFRGGFSREAAQAITGASLRTRWPWSTNPCSTVPQKGGLRFMNCYASTRPRS